ncbi:MAG: transcriptional regulator [Candidatus Electrothrix sp. AUS4]|nr:transcriptional regulator [Candidatus Electrothrix sp. AUS4]
MTAENIQKHWMPISHLFSVTNEEEYDKAVEFLDMLGTVIQAYEEKNYPFPDCDGISMLCYFMDEHGITASDLPKIGSKETVSAIISGKKELSLRHVRALSERFQVSSAVFV